jgi:hypothetical protein
VRSSSTLLPVDAVHDLQLAALRLGDIGDEVEKSLASQSNPRV